MSHKKSNSLSFFLGEKNKSLSHVIKKGSILRVILKKSLSHIEKKKFSSLYRIFGESSILWVVLFLTKTQKFNSLTHAQELSILWVILFFLKKKTILRVMLEKVQFIESCSKRFNSLSHTRKKVQFFEFFFFWKRVQFFMSSILWVILQKEEGSILSDTLKKTILWVTFKEGSILWVRLKKNQLKLRRGS